MSSLTNLYGATPVKRSFLTGKKPSIGPAIACETLIKKMGTPYKNWVEIVYLNGVYLGLESNTKIWSSTDLVTWTQRLTSTSFSWVLTTSNGMFVAIERGGSTATRSFKTSTDGVNWTDRTITMGNVGSSASLTLVKGSGDGLGMANGAIILYGDTTTSYYLYSTNGTSFSVGTTPTDYNGTAYQQWLDFRYAKGIYSILLYTYDAVNYGANTRVYDVYTSTNLSTWTRRQTVINTSAIQSALCTGGTIEGNIFYSYKDNSNNQYIKVSVDGGVTFNTTLNPDGANYVATSYLTYFPLFGGAMCGIPYSPTSNLYIWYSLDGFTWEKRPLVFPFSTITTMNNPMNTFIDSSILYSINPTEIVYEK